MKNLSIDENATGLLIGALAVGGIKNVVYIQKFDLDELPNLYSPWDGETVGELASCEKISENEREKKLERFNFFKECVLENKYTDTTIFAVRRNARYPIQIIDGIHRAVGIQKALIDQNVDKEVLKNKINLRILLVDSEDMIKYPDYIKLLTLASNEAKKNT